MASEQRQRQFIESRLGRALRFRLRNDVHHVRKRRIRWAGAKFHFLFDKRFVILRARRFDGVMIVGQGLNEYSSGPVAASGAARDLRQQLKGAFRRAKVGHIERAVGGNDTHQRDVGKIESFGHHLRAD
jgi:hypothetical protein